MAGRASYYRAYLHHYADFQNLTNVNLPEQVEFQLVLEFARENKGQFAAPLDLQITRGVIEDFKKNHKLSKVFASIGGPDSYSVRTDDINTWVEAAYESLTDMIDTFLLDGIDVYYKAFSPDADLRGLERLLEKLKGENRVISMVAATPGPDKGYYNRLFHAGCNNNDISTVLYQFHKT